MSASIYDEVKVEVSLGNLATIYGAANCYSFAEDERSKLAKKNEDLVAECERLAREINNLRCELSTRPTARELQPVTKTAINNAKEALAAHYRPITSEDNLADETVPGDRFHAVYKTLRVLVDCLTHEGIA